MRDSMNHMNPRPCIAPVVVTDNTVQTGAIIDLQGYDSLTYVIETGALVDADATFAVTILEGDTSNLADGAAVASTDLLGGLTLASFNFASDVKCFKLGYVGAKRYTQLVITPTNNTGSAPLAAIAVLGNAALGPTANPPT